MVKVTFTLDEETVEALRQAALRCAKPRSAIVREAIREYGARADRLGEDERRRMLRAIDALLAHPADRGASSVHRELREVSRARRSGVRRRP
jgi:predicted transcriptional regulator